jgi:hypothetical protein
MMDERSDKADFCERELEAQLTREAQEWANKRAARMLVARSLADGACDKDLPGGPEHEAMKGG